MQPIVDWRFPDAAHREDELLAHALDLVREAGLSGLTMKKVAARVGFTEAAAYRYFPTKQALIHALVDRLRNLFLDGVRETAQEKTLPIRDRLERIVRRHFDFLAQTDGLPILVLAEAAASGDRSLLERLRETVDAYLDVLESVLLECSEGPTHIRAREKALLLFGLPAAVAIRRRMGAEPDAEQRIPAHVIPFVIRCLTEGPAHAGGAR
jgi:AcrR family transcriptional regulator